jgi:hypothetical protein
MPSRSAVVSTLLLFAGYAIGSYGLVLVRGWNISPLSWISPLNPYQWPTDGSDPLCIPQGQLWGNGVGGIQCGGSASTSKTPTKTDYQTGTVAGANPIIVGVAGRGK